MNKIVYAVLTAVALTACTDEEFIDKEIPLFCENTNLKENSEIGKCLFTVPDTTTLVSEKEAWRIASEHNNTGNISRSSDRFVYSVECIKNSHGEPLLYVANYTGNNGFLLLSAKKEYYPILAESDNGYFDLNNIPENHPVRLWLEEQKIKIEKASFIPNEMKTSIAEQWMNYNNKKIPLDLMSRSDYTEIPEVYYDSLRRWSMDPTIEIYRYEDYTRTNEYNSFDEMTKQTIINGMNNYGNSNYGPVESVTVVLRKDISKNVQSKLLKTNWSQRAPYNDRVPNGCPIGCTTIAAGQIMNYYKFPSSINWSNIPDVGVTNTTKDFLYSLATNIGVEFSEEKSSANISQVADCLKSRYSYDVNKRDHNEDDVYRDVYDGYPVYMTGKNKTFLGITSWEGHAWVCDGISWGTDEVEIRVMTLEYRPTTYSTPNHMVEVYKNLRIASYSPRRFHFNWGWGGNYDGYYDDSNIKLSLSNGENKEFKHARENLYIRPRR